MILRFEDAVALKSKANFYITKGWELTIIKAPGFYVVLELGNLPLKGGITVTELFHD